MDELINFVEMRHLFKCAPDKFNITIKSILINMLINKMLCTKPHRERHMLFPGRFCVSPEERKKQFKIQRNADNGKVRCIICRQFEVDNSEFVICNECCKVCINENVLIAIGNIIFVCCKTNIVWNNYWGDVDSNPLLGDIRDKLYNNENYNNKGSLLKYFVDNTHKLVHRFYHTVPILFLLSLCDLQSFSGKLNKDIIFFIFKFIYS